MLKNVNSIYLYYIILYICILNTIRYMNENEQLRIKKTFDLYDFRQNQSSTFCKSLMFDFISAEEKSDHILATIMIAGNKKNIKQYKYDFKGRFWGDSTPSGLDLCNKVYDIKGNDITIKYLKEVRNINVEK